MRHIIIGVGAAGITAAKTIRARNKTDEIVMISSDEFVHSRCMLHKYISRERDEKSLNFVKEDFFEENDIYWVRGKKVIKISEKEKEVQLESGEKLSYDKLLIATGAVSFIPPIGELRDAENVFGLRDLSDAVEIARLIEDKENVLIIGSGLVGMDAAYACVERKKHVTIVEMANRILPLQLNETAGKVYQERFEEAGCKFIFGKKATETVLNNENCIEKILLDDGTEIPCDVIIVATGVRPAIACVSESGIAAERAISVAMNMETSVRDVYAAGDVTGLSGTWPNAMKQGEVAAYNMLGMNMEYVDTYAMKNTMNFFGVVTLSLGRGEVQEGDIVIEEQDSKGYRRAIIRNHKLDSILLQGDISYGGVYQYVIKNEIDIRAFEDRIFKLSYADFFKVQEDGAYTYADTDTTF